jgi:hypothetical protein
MLFHIDWIVKCLLWSVPEFQWCSVPVFQCSSVPVFRRFDRWRFAGVVADPLSFSSPLPSCLLPPHYTRGKRKSGYSGNGLSWRYWSNLESFNFIPRICGLGIRTSFGKGFSGRSIIILFFLLTSFSSSTF